MEFNKILKETRMLNEIKIDSLLKKYKEGRFSPDKSKGRSGVENISSLIGTLTDNQKNPLTYEKAKEIVQKEYKAIPSDLDNIIRQGTKEHEASKNYAELEKQRRRETRQHMKGGSAAISRGYA